jgi:hypothetical protein
MMLSRQEEELERRATLENDLKVLEQRRGSTFHQHAQAQADEVNQGRFRSIGVPNVIGATAGVASQYPAAGAHQADPVGPEPSLGHDVNQMPEPSTIQLPPPVEQLPDSVPDAAASVVSPLLPDAAQRGAGSGPSS